ncbi:MAG: ABC transporter ATP-binding protein [Desulfurococcaceae archaeon]
MVEIRVEKVTHIYIDKIETIALKDVSIVFPKGKIIGILGPSGCGKTTLLKIIAGLLRPTKGKVFFDDKDVTDWDPIRRNVAMVFQFPVAYDMSIYDNIAFPLKIRKYPKEEIDKRVKEAAEILGIPKDILSKSARGADPSLRQKIAVARAIVRDANVLLLDEPLTNLEPLVRIELKSKLKEIVQKMKITTLYVSHDQAEVLTLAEKVAVMNEGKVVQYDDTSILYEYPKNKFVGYFIGNPGMNYISCVLENNVLDCGAFKYRLMANEIEVLSKAGREFDIGIRPEHIKISKERGEISGRTAIIEKIGTAILYHVELSTGQMISIKAYEQLDIKEGDIVFITLPREKVRIFSKDGERLI